MFIHVDPPRATLVDADNFRAFAVVVNGTSTDHERVAETLEELGTVDPDGGHAWLDVAAVRRLAGDGVGERWLADFAKMIEFARTQGWTDEDGRVRAHIEWRATGAG